MKASGLFDLTGEVALVTGASSGLGLRFAEVLAANGAKVALVARRAERLDAAEEEDRSGGRQGHRDRSRRARSRQAMLTRLRRRRKGVRHCHDPRQQCRHRAYRPRAGIERRDLAQRARHQSRRGVLLVAGRRQAHDRRQQTRRHRQYRLGAGLRREQGRRGLCRRQSRRGADHQSAGAGTRFQGRARECDRARLVRDRDQRGISRRAKKARRSSARSRWAASARPAISMARCCCSHPKPARS